MKKIIVIIICLFFAIGVTEAKTSIPRVKNVQIEYKYDKRVKLTWKKNKNIDFYQIRVLKLKNDKYKLIRRARTKTNKTNKIVKKLKPRKNYYFRIRASKNNGYGPWSKRKKVKTLQLLQTRLDDLSTNLHTEGSGDQAKASFPDFELTYTDQAENANFPDEILPFRYYYSQEADLTIAICNIDYTVFYCTGKIDSLISGNDLEDCVLSAEYENGDTRLNTVEIKSAKKLPKAIYYVSDTARAQMTSLCETYGKSCDLL